MYACSVATGDEDAGASVLQFRPAGSADADPGAAVFEEMLEGFSRQQRSRSLSSTTIEARESHLRRFAAFCDSLPWEWQPVDVEDWTSHMRSGPRPLSKATIRGYQNAVSLFCSYLVDARYSWADRCMELFGTHPVQICHEWNTTAHLAEHEADPRVRPLAREEVQLFFDYADDQADIARSTKRKGWATAFRDSTLFKVTYAFGLRRREVAMLDLHDFTRNPKAPEFGRYAQPAETQPYTYVGCNPTNQTDPTGAASPCQKAVAGLGLGVAGFGLGVGLGFAGIAAAPVSGGISLGVSLAGAASILVSAASLPLSIDNVATSC